MKKLIIVAITLLALFGCQENETAKKPFVITQKFLLRREFFEYRYIDAEGDRYCFHDTNKYSVGDTIK